VDEIEKAFAGTGTDLSGVKTELTGTWLTWMEDKEASGSIFIGPPGAAKTMLAKAIGNEAGIPSVYLDFAGMQDSLVGKSGENLRTALKVIEAISGKQIFVIATCNKIASLPPEVRRRFTDGTFYFDLPTKEERDVIWRIYMKKYGLKDKGWTRDRKASPAKKHRVERLDG
jgi:SpoVK/Ycf46/Vps4 family AAA+-type ATPase